MAKVTTTIRKIPLTCSVCNGRKYAPEFADDPEGEWIKCDPCNGDGWLWITETITERTE